MRKEKLERTIDITKLEIYKLWDRCSFSLSTPLPSPKLHCFKINIEVKVLTLKLIAIPLIHCLLIWSTCFLLLRKMASRSLKDNKLLIILLKYDTQTIKLLQYLINRLTIPFKSMGIVLSEAKNKTMHASKLADQYMNIGCNYRKMAIRLNIQIRARCGHYRICRSAPENLSNKGGIRKWWRGFVEQNYRSASCFREEIQLLLVMVRHHQMTVDCMLISCRTCAIQ